MATDTRGVVFATDPASILVVANGRCWLSASDADGGRAFEGTLEPGDQQQMGGPWPLKIRLGSPTDVTVYVDGTRAEVPARPGQPIDLVFDPA